MSRVISLADGATEWNVESLDTGDFKKIVSAVQVGAAIFSIRINDLDAFGLYKQDTPADNAVAVALPAQVDQANFKQLHSHNDKLIIVHTDTVASQNQIRFVDASGAFVAADWSLFAKPSGMTTVFDLYNYGTVKLMFSSNLGIHVTDDIETGTIELLNSSVLQKIAWAGLHPNGNFYIAGELGARYSVDEQQTWIHFVNYFNPSVRAGHEMFGNDQFTVWFNKGSNTISWVARLNTSTNVGSYTIGNSNTDILGVGYNPVEGKFYYISDNLGTIEQRSSGNPINSGAWAVDSRVEAPDSAPEIIDYYLPIVAAPAV